MLFQKEFERFACKVMYIYFLDSAPLTMKLNLSTHYGRSCSLSGCLLSQAHYQGQRSHLGAVKATHSVQRGEDWQPVLPQEKRYSL